MNLLHLLFAEIRFRWLNFALSFVAVAVAATLFVAGPTIIQGYAADTEKKLGELQTQTETRLKALDKKTRRIMRDLGVNLRIVHKDTNMGALYTDFVAHDFPEDYVNRLAQAKSIDTIVHLVATLQERIEWNNRKIFLVGVKPVLTTSQKNEEKPHMVQSIAPGTVLVGHELGVGRKAGEQIDINGEQFTIAKILPEYGEQRDVQLALDLPDAQRVLGKKGRINQIMALNCKCKGDRISIVRKELEGVLPETKVTEHASRATAREAQRNEVEKAANLQTEMLKNNRDRTQQALAMLLGVLSPLVVFASAVIVGLLTWLNIRERRPEIGVLRALGKGAVSIAGLLMMRAALTGLIGGLLGVGICILVLKAAPGLVDGDSLDIALDELRPAANIVLMTILGAPLVSMMAAYLPSLVALRQDPSVVLMDN